MLDNANQVFRGCPGSLWIRHGLRSTTNAASTPSLPTRLYSYSSALSWVQGKHNFKFGGEQRLFFNNFQQPPYPTGYFHFAQTVTENVVGAFNPDQGNPFADILTGVGDYWRHRDLSRRCRTALKKPDFYAQDDWKVTPKLTLNLGLRYEWSTPYTERNNRLQFSDFTGNSGVTVPGLPLISGPLQGTTNLPTPSHRSVSRWTATTGRPGLASLTS